MESQERTLPKVELQLKRTSDDPVVQDPAFQAELRTFSGSLRAAGVSFSQRAMTFDAVDATGYALAEYVIKELGPAAVGVIGTAVGAWITGRSGRKVRLKVGDIEVEARTKEEVTLLLQQAVATQAQRDGKSGSAGDEP